MIIRRDESLRTKTTFRIGGVAKRFYIPQTERELIELVQSLVQEHISFKVLSGGSNLLVNDKKSFDAIIYMGQAVDTITDNGCGNFYIGASNRIQKVIRYVNSTEYGGFEELIGLPALFGGIIYMNAGIGGRNSVKFNISDFVVRVKVLEIKTGKICWMDKNECDFGYRKSIFQKNNFVILGADIVLHHQTKEQSEKRIKDRLQHCKDHQEWGKGCVGSCFSIYNGKILRIISIFHKFVRKGIYQAENNVNWLVNNGAGTYDDAIHWINVCKLLHKITFQEIECEVRIWE